MSWLSWRKWPDLIVDFGMEVYLPWKISTGSVLYRDVMYLAGGPVSQYYHALLFKLFGASLNTLLVSNFIILALLLLFIYRTFLRCADQLTATTICLTIVCTFAFAQFLGDVANYNYICPYSHELTHGIALSILTIALFSRWLKTNRTAFTHFDTAAGEVPATPLPLPARHERGEGRGEGLPIKATSSPQPSPPLGEEREKKNRTDLAGSNTTASDAAVPLPLPARHEWGEGRGEGSPIKGTSSPRPSPPLRVEEREKTSYSPALLIAAGLCFGLVFLTKAEVSLALTAAVVAGFFLARRTGRPPFRPVFIFLAAALVPLVGFFLYFKAHNDFAHSLRRVAWAWSPLLTTGASQNNFYKSGMGLDQPWFHLQKALIQLIVVSAVLGLCFWRFRLQPKNSFERILVPCLIALLVTAAACFDWRDCGYGLPFLTLATIGILYRQWQGVGTSRPHNAGSVEPIRGQDVPTPPHLSLPLLWAVFALALMAKLGVYPRIWHYGFALAMPATVAAIYLLLWLLPEMFEKHGVNRRLFQITMALLIFTGLGALVLRQYDIYKKKTYPVGSGANRIMAYGPQADPKGATVSEALQWIHDHIAPTETMAVLPEGVTLNFLSQRSNSTPYLVFNPAEFQAYGEATIFEAYRKNPPDYIVLVQRDSSEFGIKDFGQEGGFGVEMMQWINENYKPVNLIGYEPLKNSLFGIKFLKRNNQNGTPP